jgi:hypothetical protein
MTSRDPVVTKYTCDVSLSNNKFLMTATTTNAKQDNETSTYQQCFQFIRRSPNVVQIARSQPAAVLSSCDVLILDEFLLVWPKLDDGSTGSAAVGCGLVGGYTFWLADAGGSSNPICADSFLPPIIESDCGAAVGDADNIRVDFRQLNCMGRLSMPMTLRLYCLGAWSVDNYTFSVVTDNNPLWPKLWLFRFPAATGVAVRDIPIVGHVTTNIAATRDAEMQPSKTGTGSVVYSVHFTPTSFLSLCSDEATGCNASRCADDDYYGGAAEVHCQKTCGTCSSSNASYCQFADDSQGVWIEFSSERGHRIIDVNETEIKTTDSELQGSSMAVCADLSTDRWFTSAQRRPTATIYTSTGCRPLLTCYEFVRRTVAVLVYRVGRQVQWPAPSLPLTAGAVCGDAQFNADKTNPTDVSRYRVLVKAGIDPSSSNVHAPCGFSGWMQLNGRLQATGSNVTGQLDTCGFDVFTFRYVQRQTDGSSSVTQTHRCLAAFTDAATNDMYIITASSEPSGNEDAGDAKQSSDQETAIAYCWLFQQNAWEPRPRLYLTLAADCNQETSVDVLYRSGHHCIAQFDIIPPPSASLQKVASPTVLSEDCSADSYQQEHKPSPSTVLESMTNPITSEPQSSSTEQNTHRVADDNLALTRQPTPGPPGLEQMPPQSPSTPRPLIMWQGSTVARRLPEMLPDSAISNAPPQQINAADYKSSSSSPLQPRPPAAVENNGNMVAGEGSALQIAVHFYIAVGLIWAAMFCVRLPQ